MDLLSLQRKNNELNRACPQRDVNPDEESERIMDLVKKVKSTKATKNRWGGQSYPINVTNYGEFVSALQTLSWILRDMGFQCKFLTRTGISYDKGEYHSHASLFDNKASKIVALVALSPAKKKDEVKHFKIGRDQKSLRIRSYTDEGRALAPMSAGVFAGSQELGTTTVKEIVKVMQQHTNLDPENADSLRKFGRLVMNAGYQATGGSTLKSRMKMEFSKVSKV